MADLSHSDCSNAKAFVENYQSKRFIALTVVETLEVKKLDFLAIFKRPKEALKIV
jgi:hypothetical protein